MIPRSSPATFRGLPFTRTISSNSNAAPQSAPGTRPASLKHLLPHSTGNADATATTIAQLARNSILPLRVYNIERDIIQHSRRDRPSLSRFADSDLAQNLASTPKMQLERLRKLLRTQEDPVLAYALWKRIGEKERRDVVAWSETAVFGETLEVGMDERTWNVELPAKDEQGQIIANKDTDDSLPSYCIAHDEQGENGTRTAFATTLPIPSRLTPDDRSAVLAMLLRHVDPTIAAHEARRIMFRPVFGYQEDSNGFRRRDKADKRDVLVWLAILSRAGQKKWIRSQYAKFFKGPEDETVVGSGKWEADLTAAKQVFACLADRTIGSVSAAVRGIIEPNEVPMKRDKNSAVNTAFDDPLKWWEWMCGDLESILDGKAISSSRQQLWRESDPEVWSLLAEYFIHTNRDTAERVWGFLLDSSQGTEWKQGILSDPRPWNSFAALLSDSPEPFSATLDFLDAMSLWTKPREETFDAILAALVKNEDYSAAEWAWNSLVLRPLDVDTVPESESPLELNRPRPFHSSFEAMLGLYNRLLKNPNLTDAEFDTLAEKAWTIYLSSSHLRVKPSVLMLQRTKSIAHKAVKRKSDAEWKERRSEIDKIGETYFGEKVLERALAARGWGKHNRKMDGHKGWNKEEKEKRESWSEDDNGGKESSEDKDWKEEKY